MWNEYGWHEQGTLWKRFKVSVYVASSRSGELCWIRRLYSMILKDDGVESRGPFWRRICTEERTSSIKVCAFPSFMLSQSVAFQCTPSYLFLSSQMLVTHITLLQNTLCNPVLDFSLPIRLLSSTTCRHSYRGRGRPWLILAAPEETRRFAA